MEDFFKNFLATQSLFYPLVWDMIFPKSIVGTENFQEFLATQSFLSPCPGHDIFKVKGE